nr:EOG090X028J [Artemia franciscana]
MEPKFKIVDGIEVLVPRKIPTQNILLKIRNRELGQRTLYNLRFERAVYQSVFPNKTFYNVERPSCFFRKFSPCGNYFIAYTADQSGIEIYSYKGAAAAGDLLECLDQDVEPSADIKQQVFDRFFALKHTVTMASTTEQLNRECSLFTDNGRFLIVASSGVVVEDPRYPRPFDDVYRNNEAIPIHPRFSLEDITVYVIDIHRGLLLDSRQFRTDKIYLAHNQGLYLYKNILSILSVQHQTIHIFQISSEGELIEVRTIGRFCHDDDEFILSSAIGRVAAVRNYREVQITGLKHRMLVFLFKEAFNESKAERKPDKWRLFYRKFQHLRWLRLWKMQLLDDNHLLLKYSSQEVVTLRAPEPNSQISFFVIYRMDTAQVLAVYENTSEEMLRMYEDYNDFFKDPGTSSDTQNIATLSNNVLMTRVDYHATFKQTALEAKHGNRAEVVKRILGHVPIPAQSHTCSPYVDISLFSFDDRWVSPYERPKAGTDHPLRNFPSVYGNELKLKLYLVIHKMAVMRERFALTFAAFSPLANSINKVAFKTIAFHHRTTLPN